MAARELTLDSKMRAFFRLSTFSHRYSSITLSGDPFCLEVGRCLDMYMSADTAHYVTRVRAMWQDSCWLDDHNMPEKWPLCVA